MLVQRLCGICPVSHHLCAAKAVDGIVGVDRLTPTGEKMRRLMHYGQMFQSHALHFFHLASPDLLFGFDAPVEKRNVVGVIAAHPDLAVQGVMMRKFGQEIIKATAGKKIHGTGAIPGGINKNLSIAERDVLLADMRPDARVEPQGGRARARLHAAEPRARSRASAPSTPITSRSCAPTARWTSTTASCARSTRRAARILDQVDPLDYLDVLAEEVRPWSYMKFPYLKTLGAADGWFRVGPLARVNTCDFIDTPEAEAARREFLAVGGGKPCNLTMGYHWARMIELLHSAEVIARLLDDPDLQGDGPGGAGRRAARRVRRR